MAKFLNKLRLPNVLGAIAGAEGEVWMDTDKHQPRFINADGTAASFDEGSKFNRFTANRWYANQIGTASTGTMTASRAFAIPLALPRYAQLGGLALEVTTAWTTAGNVRVGVFADTGSGMPGTRLLDAGAVAASVGIKTWTTALDLPAGLFWLVGVSQGGSGSTVGVFRSVSGLQDFIGDPATTPSLSGTFNSYYTDTNFTGALPTTFGTVAGIAAGPRFMVKFNF